MFGLTGNEANKCLAKWPAAVPKVKSGAQDYVMCWLHCNSY